MACAVNSIDSESNRRTRWLPRRKLGI